MDLLVDAKACAEEPSNPLTMSWEILHTNKSELREAHGTREKVHKG